MIPEAERVDFVIVIVVVGQIDWSMWMLQVQLLESIQIHQIGPWRV